MRKFIQFAIIDGTTITLTDDGLLYQAIDVGLPNERWERWLPPAPQDEPGVAELPVDFPPELIGRLYLVSEFDYSVKEVFGWIKAVEYSSLDNHHLVAAPNPDIAKRYVRQYLSGDTCVILSCIYPVSNPASKLILSPGYHIAGKSVLFLKFSTTGQP